MATITTTISDNKFQAVLDAVCLKYGYDPDNGQSKLQFAKSQIAEMLKTAYAEMSRASRMKAVDQDVSTDVGNLNIT